MVKLHQAVKHIAHRTKRDNENGARKGILEDLFYDFNRSRAQVYKMNFLRGIFFGIGSAIGATLVLALIVWLLSFFVDLPGVGHTVQNIKDIITTSRAR